MNLFEKFLSVPVQDIELKLFGFLNIPWVNHLLNPRRLRGSDFLMRWSQGSWSETRVIQAINNTRKFFAIPYGPSGIAPKHDVREFELYFEKLEKAGLGKLKRPDLLIFKALDRDIINKKIEKLGGLKELPFISENTDTLKQILSKVVLAIECENSLWVGRKMPDFNSKLKPQRWLKGGIGLKKTAVLPTVIIKEEDREPLNNWQNNINLPIHIWHVFFDLAFGISLDNAEELFSTGKIQPTIQTFQAPGGATTQKKIYKIYYHYAYPVGESIEKPKLMPAYIEDKNGHILPYVKFMGGKLKLLPEALEVLEEN